MTVGIVGLGLIGGSIGLALREPGRKIVGWDPSADAVKVATERFCIDQSLPIEEVAQADIVFVASPPKAIIANLDAILAAKGPETVFTDCGSVKSDIVAWAKAKKEPNFVGGHPMAGHEKSGAQFASAWMFRNARWILTPTTSTANKALKKVEEVVKLMGAVPVRIDAAKHDRHVAILSHLPHAFAAILVELGTELEHGDAAGGSWRDLTRVGGVDPGLWTEIFMGNRLELINVAKDAESRLAQIRQALENQDPAAIKQILENAKIAKKKHSK